MRVVKFCLIQVPCSPILAATPLATQEPEALRGDVPYVPTPPELVEAMLKPGEVKSGDILNDLYSLRYRGDLYLLPEVNPRLRPKPLNDLSGLLITPR
jgi:hypothetical protein